MHLPLSHVVKLSGNLLELSQERVELSCNPGSFKRALPDVNNLPAFFSQGFLGFFIIGLIPVYFGEPPLGSGLRNFKVFTVCMPMPETAVNKYHRAVFR